MMAEQKMNYEDALGGKAFRSESDKTYIDKLLGRKEVDQLKRLIEKDELDRSDLLRLLYLLTGGELKIVNLTEWDRYLLGKYYTWIRDLVKVAEFLYDYEDNVKTGIVKFGVHKEEIGDGLKSIKKMVLHDVKFSVDIYLFLTRSTLSLSGAAFDRLSKSRYEYEYGNYPTGQNVSSVENEKPKSFWRR